ncbi:MAG: ribonuclease Z [Saprospiraceae bacterium]
MLLTILGHSAGGPYHGRPFTAQVLQVEQHLFLIDCGEGTQMQLFHYSVRFDRCNQIFISHLHGDHVFGLMGIITNWCLKKRTKTLQIFSPPGLRELVESTCRICQVRVPYPIEFYEVKTDHSTKIFENQKVEVWSVPLSHRVPTSGWLFREKIKARNMRADKIGEYGIHYSLIPGIKAGNDLTLPDGRIVPNAELTTPPPAPLAYAFCSDTAPSPVVVEAVRGVDLLYHEATFTNEHTAEAAISFHSTAEQAAGIAAQAGVGRLLIGHFSGRYADTEGLLAEARAVFARTEVAEAGLRVEVGKQV